ncbi:hypothetical protein [Yersinia aldovae]|uniref:hypothetical protein n=1 Tax=Yersinia aldovae TaxID=29483 RepID=UPI0011A2C40D|nr:hypothetical protein [Yersinia aldovae]
MNQNSILALALRYSQVKKREHVRVPAMKNKDLCIFFGEINKEKIKARINQLTQQRELKPFNKSVSMAMLGIWHNGSSVRAF